MMQPSLLAKSCSHRFARFTVPGLSSGTTPCLHRAASAHHLGRPPGAQNGSSPALVLTAVAAESAQSPPRPRSSPPGGWRRRRCRRHWGAAVRLPRALLHHAAHRRRARHLGRCRPAAAALQPGGGAAQRGCGRRHTVPTFDLSNPSGPSAAPRCRLPTPHHTDIQHTEARLRSALKELEIVRGEEARALAQRTAVLQREHEAAMQALERRFLADAEALQVGREDRCPGA